MPVFILTKQVDETIQFRIVTHQHPLSEIITLTGKDARFFGGNPYSLYSDAIREYTGWDYQDITITVCTAHSGNL